MEEIAGVLSALDKQNDELSGFAANVIRKLQIQLREAVGEFLRQEQKIQHGCTDSICPECDGLPALP